MHRFSLSLSLGLRHKPMANSKSLPLLSLALLASDEDPFVSLSRDIDDSVAEDRR